ncbi:methyltransferase domain-containing protein [Candidatus Bathyarchaeota archaeon]|nr:methyltransferase domain-containing protein [Candidatus Bathyarchaeota archaeon]
MNLYSVAWNYLKYRTRPGILLRWVVLKATLLANIKDNSNIVDLGGFDGTIPHFLKQIIPSIQVTIVDLDSSGLEVAQSRGFQVINASATDIPGIDDDTIDVVFCMDLLEHVKEDEAIIHESARMLKRHGLLIITTPFEGGIPFPLLDKSTTRTINLGWGHVRLGYSLNRVRELLENCDLHIIYSTTFNNPITRFFNGLQFKIPMLRRFFKFLDLFCMAFEPFLRFGGKEHLVIARMGSDQG